MRRFVAVDEAGNFDFSPKGSRYFIVTSVVFLDNSLASSLAELRHELAWRDEAPVHGFHATEDRQSVRDEVFGRIAPSKLRIDATILEKRKAIPRLREAERFYKTALYYHLRHVIPRVVTEDDELLVAVATLSQSKKKCDQQLEDLKDVLSQVTPHYRWHAACLGAATDYSVQVADYCCWAIQRYWERGDNRSRQPIQHLIASEFDMFATGTTDYY